MLNSSGSAAYRIIYTALIVLILSSFTSCGSNIKIDSCYGEEENRKELRGSSCFVKDAVFVDWTYPSHDKLKKIFPDRKSMMKFSYSAMKYHGCIFEFSDSGLTRKFLVMVPRDKGFTVRKIKGLYASKESVMIKMTYIADFPAQMWEFPQLKWPAMPVFTLDFIF